MLHVLPNHMLSSNERPPNNANVKLNPGNCVGRGASDTLWSKLHTIQQLEAASVYGKLGEAEELQNQYR